MKKFVPALILTAIVAATPVAVAEPEFYGNFGGGAFLDDDATLAVVTVRGGAFFSEYFGAEIEGSFGVGNDNIDALGVTANVEVSNSVGGFVVGRLPIEGNYSGVFEIFGRLGYMTTEFEVEVFGTSGSLDVDGFAAGVGGTYYFTPNIGIRGDYTRFEANEAQIDGGVNILTVAAVYKFGG